MIWNVAGSFPGSSPSISRATSDTAIRRTNSDFARQRMAHFRHREMRTRVNSRRAGEDFQRTQIANADDVKLAVSQFCIGRDLHPATEVTRIRDAQIQNDEMTLVRIVELDRRDAWARCALRFAASASRKRDLRPLFTRSMTLVLIPHDATPTKYRVASFPL